MTDINNRTFMKPLDESKKAWQRAFIEQHNKRKAAEADLRYRIQLEDYAVERLLEYGMDHVDILNLLEL